MTERRLACATDPLDEACADRNERVSATGRRVESFASVGARAQGVARTARVHQTFEVSPAHALRADGLRGSSSNLIGTKSGPQESISRRVDRTSTGRRHPAVAGSRPASPTKHDSLVWDNGCLRYLAGCALRSRHAGTPGHHQEGGMRADPSLLRVPLLGCLDPVPALPGEVARHTSTHRNATTAYQNRRPQWRLDERRGVGLAGPGIHAGRKRPVARPPAALTSTRSMRPLAGVAPEIRVVRNSGTASPHNLRPGLVGALLESVTEGRAGRSTLQIRHRLRPLPRAPRAPADPGQTPAGGHSSGGAL
jgi:hypothetical protein